MMALLLPIAEIRRCAQDTQFLDAVAGFYADLDRQIAERRPVCTNRGACCRFEAFEHNLFVTSTELAYFLGAVGSPPRSPQDQGEAGPDRPAGVLGPPLLVPPDRTFCPYQQGGGCTARTARPAGCRIFFCDPAAADWQPDASEAAIRALAAIGRRFDLPYAYVEWTDALRALGGTPVAAPDPATGVQVRIDIHERPS